MAAFHEYARYDALGLKELVARKEVTPAEILEAALDAVDRVNPRINAIVTGMRSEAQAQLCNGLPAGPLMGVPIAVKDEYISCASVPNNSSSRLCQGYARSYDSELVRRYRQAGILIIGKTNLPEFGASVTTEPVFNGRCNNPWNPAYTTGGSSGGSAAAVAAGIVPIAYANDGAGSIRIPSSCCGVFGLKPTRARISTAPDGGEYWNGLVIEHAITRSVRDSAALLDATEGAAPGDLYCAPPKRRPFLDEVGAAPGRLRIAFSARPASSARIDPECVAAMSDTAALCESLGHYVEEASPEFDGDALAAAIGQLLRIHLAAGIDDMAALMSRRPTLENIERAHYALAEQGRRISGTEMLAVLEFFAQTARKVAPFWQRYDMLLTPTLASPPVRHGYITTDDPDAQRYLQRVFDFIPFTPIANVTGNPAMSLPLYWSVEGLPIGTHFIGRFGDEASLLRLAAQLEQARPWASKTSPIHASTAAK